MRQLTLHEKISIKGLFKRMRWGRLAELDMKTAVFFWPYLYGGSITHWYKISKRSKIK